MNLIGRLVAVSRPRFWFYLAGPVLVGLVFGIDRIDALVQPLAIALIAYFLFPANLFLYGVNDVFDADVDLFNPKKTGREIRYTGERTTRIAILVSIGLGVATVAITRPMAWPWFFAFFLLGASYSIPPVWFKRRPLLDSISNGLYILPGVGAYVAVADALPPLEIIAGAWLWTMGMHTFSAIPDIQPDRRAGIQTTATVLGPRRSLAYCFGCWALAAVAFALVDSRGGFILALYPVLILGIARAEIAVHRAYWWFPTINVAVGALFTVYGLVLLVYG